MKTYLFIALLLSALFAVAQPSEWSMNKDNKGNVYYRRTFRSGHYPRQVLYHRVRDWMVNRLNASDNWMQEDAMNNDSIKTSAYVILGDGQAYKNQFVSFIATAYFNGDTIDLWVKGLNYHGTQTGSNEPLDLPIDSLLRSTDPGLKAAWNGFDLQMQALNANLYASLK